MPGYIETYLQTTDSRRSTTHSFDLGQQYAKDHIPQRFHDELTLNPPQTSGQKLYLLNELIAHEQALLPHTKTRNSGLWQDQNFINGYRSGLKAFHDETRSEIKQEMGLERGHKRGKERERDCGLSY